MKHLQRTDQNRFQCPECCCLGTVSIAVKTGFYHLDIPVAELFPDEIINLGKCNTQFIFIQIFRNILSQSIYLGQNPFICCSQFGQLYILHLCFIQIHHDKTGCIPYFIGKVAACFHTLPVETHVITGRIAGYQCHTKSICTVFINNLQRIDTIAKRFTHLASLGITYQTMDQNRVERCFAGLFQT